MLEDYYGSLCLDALHFSFSKNSPTFKKFGVYDMNFVQSVRKTWGGGLLTFEARTTPAPCVMHLIPPHLSWL